MKEKTKAQRPSAKEKPYWQIQCVAQPLAKWIVWQTFERLDCARKAFKSQFQKPDASECRLVRCEVEEEQ